jgi:hypothetical protein
MCLKKRSSPDVQKASKLWKGRIEPEKLANLRFRPGGIDFPEDKFLSPIQEREWAYVQRHAIKQYGSGECPDRGGAKVIGE